MLIVSILACPFGPIVLSCACRIGQESVKMRTKRERPAWRGIFGQVRRQESSSFLKKRTKKLLLVSVRAGRIGRVT